MAENRDRGQSEVVGTLLLVGIVTLAISGAGSIIIFNIYGQEGDQGPLIECSIEYTNDNVTITHLGGESADIGSLTAILRNESSESRVPFNTMDGGGDSEFEPGDSAILGPISQETQVLLVTENDIVCDSTVQPMSICMPGSTTVGENTDQDTAVAENANVQSGVRVDGNITAGGSVVIESGARVTKNIRAGGSITIKSGARVDGDVDAGASITVESGGAIDGDSNGNRGSSYSPCTA